MFINKKRCSTEKILNEETFLYGISVYFVIYVCS